MKTTLISLLALVSLVWGWDVAHSPAPAGTHVLWLARQEGLYLSGLLSIAMLSLAMLLATRPVWLETPLGGMDRIYRTHKWAGILAVVFAALHWLIEMSDELLKAFVGRQGRVPKAELTGFFEFLRDAGKDMGEWAIYGLLAMLAITLYKKFPYSVWRILHRVMPVLYLVLAFHAAVLVPTDYWGQSAGALLALLLMAGAYGAVLSLWGLIGKRRQVTGQVTGVSHPAPDITTVQCRLDGAWRGHRAGQFAFVTFDTKEGAHPFTIASANQGDQTLGFEIKALGDYTTGLAQRVHTGQTVCVEGPYGRFDMSRHNLKARQIWVAGGIGITPFLAWLESMQGKPDQSSDTDLHYCTRDQTQDALLPRLQALCAALPGIHLHIHGARQGETLTAAALGASGNSEIWFCGPTGLATALRTGMQALGLRPVFHQEAFDMR